MKLKEYVLAEYQIVLFKGKPCNAGWSIKYLITSEKVFQTILEDSALKKCVKKIIANSKHRELVYVISYCLFHSLEKVLHIPALIIWWSLKSCTELNISLLLTIMKQPVGTFWTLLQNICSVKTLVKVWRK